MSQAAPRPDALDFETIFRTYYDALVALAEWYVGSTETAEEIVDDVFVALWTQREQRVAPNAVRGYLFTATRNRALNAARDRRNRARLLKSTPDVLPLAPREADAAVRERDLAVATQRAVAALPPRARTILTLHRQAGLSFTEIAELLKLSPRTVEGHLATALRHLRRRLASFLSVLMVI
jgi:RNA polymerase sigma-70 factor, ECF subfamily